MVNFISELRYALRSLAKAPVFCAVAVISLALGIGANTGVFTMLDQVLLGYLPVENPGGLVQLKAVGEHYGSNTGMNSLSYPMYSDIRDRNQAFSGIFCASYNPSSVSFQGRSERAALEVVSGTYFPTLGLKPALGRLFTPDDDRMQSGAPYIVLGYDYWQTRFNGDRGVIGTRILVNNRQLTVVGVAPKGYFGIAAMMPTHIYAPVMMARELTSETRPFDNRRRRWVVVFGRLKPGLSAQQAKASIQPVFHQILETEVRQAEFSKASPYAREQFLKMSLDLLPGGGGQNIPRMFLEGPVWAMTAMVWLVLLIACANVANLIIARSAARQKEIAVRLAIGAGRGRIVRQLLIESGILALAGGILGMAIAPWTMRLFARVMPDMDPPLRIDLAPNFKMLLYALAVSAMTAVIFGLAPALQATRQNIGPVLKGTAGGVIGGGQARWRKMLVVAQVSLSLLLLIAAGLFARSLGNLRDLHPGFDVMNLVSFAVDPRLNGYDPARAKLFYRQMNQELAALPGAQSAAFCVSPPLSYSDWDSDFSVEGHAPRPGEDMNAWVNYVSPGYFGTLKIPLYTGRDFRDTDASGAATVAVVNQKFAKHFFGSAENAIGRHLGEGTDPGTKLGIEIVGVVGDSKYQTMKQEIPREVYLAYLQRGRLGQMTGYVRTALGPGQMFPQIRAALRKLDANLPVFQLKTVEKQRDDSLAVERLAAVLSTGFGALATILATVGLYGVMAFLVARRTREIGIRMALGASLRDVLWLVAREVLILVGIGIGIGLPAALAVAQLLRNQLFGIAPHDPWVMALAAAGMAAVALLAGYLPARRAARVNPVNALRYE
jgi:predicted permease